MVEYYIKQKKPLRSINIQKISTTILYKRLGLSEALYLKNIV